MSKNGYILFPVSPQTGARSGSISSVPFDKGDEVGVRNRDATVGDRIGLVVVDGRDGVVARGRAR